MLSFASSSSPFSLSLSFAFCPQPDQQQLQPKQSKAQLQSGLRSQVECMFATCSRRREREIVCVTRHCARQKSPSNDQVKVCVCLCLPFALKCFDSIRFYLRKVEDKGGDQHPTSSPPAPSSPPSAALSPFAFVHF